MALPRLFPGSISTLVRKERISEAHEGESKEGNVKQVCLTVACLEMSDLRVGHTRKSAWIAGRGFGRPRVIMEDAFYGWIVWD